MCGELVMPAVIAASLTNDLFSYEKEQKAAEEAGLSHVVNGLWVLMQEHKITLEEAKQLCRTRIKEEVSKYVQIIEETNARTDLSDDAKKYVELVQYSVSGNVVWSLQCPRYHSEKDFNERQKLRASHGVKRTIEPDTKASLIPTKRKASDLPDGASECSKRVDSKSPETISCNGIHVEDEDRKNHSAGSAEESSEPFNISISSVLDESVSR